VLTREGKDGYLRKEEHVFRELPRQAIVGDIDSEEIQLHRVVENILNTASQQIIFQKYGLDILIQA
jgi:hypothetical protein